jgi:hypothetical protein
MFIPETSAYVAVIKRSRMWYEVVVNIVNVVIDVTSRLRRVL